MPRIRLSGSFARLLTLLAVLQVLAGAVVFVLFIGHARQVTERKLAMGGLVTCRTVRDAFHQAEAALRGYALGGQPAFLRTHREGLRRGETALDQLRARADERPELAEYARRVDQAAAEKRAWMAQTLRLAEARAVSRLERRFREGTGPEWMEDLDHALERIEDRERDRVRSLDRSASWHLGIGIGCLTVTTLGAFFLLLGDILDRRRTEARLRHSEQIIRELSGGTAQAVGRAFFDALAVQATQALGTRWAAVVQFDTADRFGLLALADGTRLLAPPTFESAGLICRHEPSQRVCFVAEGAQQSLPDHPLVRWLGAQSFLGVHLPDRPQVQGALLVLDDKPMTGTDLAIPALRVLADRAAAELERLRTEQDLLQAQKFEALGALAGGVVHDSNNLLAAIQSATELVDMRLSPHHAARHPLQVIQKSVQRGREMNQRILAFTRGGDARRQTVDLSAIVREACDLLATTGPAAVAVQANVEDAVWVEGDPGRLYQVVLNLGLNALQAMKDRPGSLVMSLQPKASDAPNGKDCACLSVTDSGCGMEPASLARVFDPFFTTKREGEGTGLGLFVVQNIVHQHGGEVRVDSEPGVGTTFRVYLPSSAAPAGAEPTTPEELKGNERILFVESDELLLALGKQGLEALGYRVATRTNASLALDALLFGVQPTDLLIAAHHPPVLDGATLLRRARALQPGLHGILMMDVLGSITPSLESLEGPDQILSRPATPMDLARAIRAILSDAKRPTSSPDRPPAGVRILVAEDAAAERRWMVAALAKAGYLAEEAADGQAAWERVADRGDRGSIQLIVSDLSMPVMDGFELLRRLRDSGGNLPVLVVTGRDDVQAFRRAMDLGAADFLLKPLRPEVLVAGVDRLLQAHFQDAQ